MLVSYLPFPCCSGFFSRKFPMLVSETLVASSLILIKFSVSEGASLHYLLKILVFGVGRWYQVQNQGT
uniref:Uncharacterized protein n=1 Tax=Solanum lycopersicum TaxID=4081 RepID=A0A3Q7ELD8_SOLLC